MKKITLYHIFSRFAKILKKVVPSLETKLKHAEINQTAVEYLSKSFLLSFLLFAIVFLGTSAVFFHQGGGNIFVGFLLGFCAAVFSMMYIINYPSVVINRRAREIELNLFFALQSMLIQISSGANIFNAMVNIASGNRYGKLSEEFRRAVEDVRSGRPIIEALEEMVFRNPSRYFNESLWHIINAIKTGANLKENLEDIVDSLYREQSNVVRIFGSQLSLLSMAYMMTAIIIPSLGVTVLLMVSSMGRVNMGLEENHFWIFLILTIGLQILFMTVIKSKRPPILGV